MLLGDQVEKWLSGLGITQEWYVKIKLEYGLPPTCDCGSRKKWLNRVHAWWLRQ